MHNLFVVAHTLNPRPFGLSCPKHGRIRRRLRRGGGLCKLCEEIVNHDGGAIDFCLYPPFAWEPLCSRRPRPLSRECQKVVTFSEIQSILLILGYASGVHEHGLPESSAFSLSNGHSGIVIRRGCHARATVTSPPLALRLSPDSLVTTSLGFRRRPSCRHSSVGIATRASRPPSLCILACRGRRLLEGDTDAGRASDYAFGTNSPARAATTSVSLLDA